MTAPLRSTLQIGKGWLPEECGGLDRYYYELIRHLQGAGIGVRGLVTGSSHVSVDSGGAVSAFAPTHSGLTQRWRGVRRDAREAMSHKSIDVVAAHFALYTAPCLDLFGAAPIVVHFHGPWAAESQVEGGAPAAVRLKAGIERSVYRRARRCITLSRAFAGVLETVYGIPADRIDVIPGGVDVARWSSPSSKQEARAALGWPQDRPIVFTVRRLARRMGLEDLVEAMVTTLRRVPDAMLMVGGKGPLLEELQVRSHSLGVSSQVCFVGYLPDHQLPLAFRAADLSVVPSASLEGFGLVVAESLASGTPALVSAVGGLPETIEGLAPQCIVREAGAASWGLAIADALTGVTPLPSPEQAVRYARERFDWSVVLPRILHTYSRAMQ